MQFHPPRMILLPRRHRIPHRRQFPLFILLVAPHAIRPHICTVQIRLRGIEDHAMDGGFGAVFVILDVFSQGAGGRGAEDIAISGVLVEWITVDAVGGLAGGEDEDGARACVSVVSFSCESSVSACRGQLGR